MVNADGPKIKGIKLRRRWPEIDQEMLGMHEGPRGDLLLSRYLIIQPQYSSLTSMGMWNVVQWWPLTAGQVTMCCGIMVSNIFGWITQNHVNQVNSAQIQRIEAWINRKQLVPQFGIRSNTVVSKLGKFVFTYRTSKTDRIITFFGYWIIILFPLPIQSWYFQVVLFRFQLTYPYCSIDWSTYKLQQDRDSVKATCFYFCIYITFKFNFAIYFES